MTSPEPPDQLTPDLPAGTGPGSSPLWPRHLFDLFFRPTKFFKGQLALGRLPYVLLFTWVLGMCACINRFDMTIMRAQLSGHPEQLQGIPEAWRLTWGVVLLGGVFYGALVWWIAGWWCKVRLAWSGAPSPNARLARLLLVYSSFVYAAPVVLVLLAKTVEYSNYPAASKSETALGLVGLAAVFWSFATTYKGALALFPVGRGRARLWFIVLPALFYLLAGVGIAALRAAAA